jgi:hypothetical protein
MAAYGEFWDSQYVDWGAPGKGKGGQLLGSAKIAGREVCVDAWAQVAIYVLYDNYRPIYVGQSGSATLGARLRAHRTDRLGGRWDRFSWYALVPFTLKGVPKKARKTTNVDRETAVDHLEGILISATEPALNKLGPRFREGTVAVEQKVTEEQARTARQILEDLAGQVAELQAGRRPQ